MFNTIGIYRNEKAGGRMKYKAVVPAIAVAFTVFLAVYAAFLCYNAFDAKSSINEKKTEISDFMQKNIFISVCDSEKNTLDVNYVISLDPKEKTVKLLKIPSSARVEIASSNQMLKDVVNIGGTDMLKEQLKKLVPLPMDYYLIIKSDDIYSGDGDYGSIIEYAFTSYLWETENLEEYLRGVLSLSSTDLTLIRTKEYAEFLNGFSQHTTEIYSLPGNSERIGDKTYFSTDYEELCRLINENFLN